MACTYYETHGEGSQALREARDKANELQRDLCDLWRMIFLDNSLDYFGFEGYATIEEHRKKWIAHRKQDLKRAIKETETEIKETEDNIASIKRLGGLPSKATLNRLARSEARKLALLNADLETSTLF